MNKERSIDLNCDLGEAATPEQLDVEARIMAYVTSVNIACGVHAGDAALMRSTVQLARQHDLAIGAHPGLPNRDSGGRREQPLSPSFVQDLILAQVGELMAISQAEGLRLSHVKPHGALYHTTATHPAAARALVAAAAEYDPSLAILGLPGSELLAAADAAGLDAFPEAFADRAYRPDGGLVSRREAGSVLTDPDEVAARAVRIATDNEVVAIDGTVVGIRARSICVHGDTPGAVELARAVRSALDAAGIGVYRFTS